jgi:hypothetical protein
MHSALAMGLCSVVLGLALGTVQPMVMSTCTRSRRDAPAWRGARPAADGHQRVERGMPMLFGAPVR